MSNYSCCGQFFFVHVHFHFVVVVGNVGTSMEGNFLGGTKNTKKVVHFECGSTQGKWFANDGGARAINLVVVGSICTTAKAQRPTYKQEKRKTDLSRTSESLIAFFFSEFRKAKIF